MFFLKRYSQRLLKKRLEKIIPENVPLFSFDGIQTYAKIYDVYDGDSVKIIFEHNGKLIKYKCRLYGIDTPEIRTRDKQEKELGFIARDFLRSCILDKVLKVDLLEFDKYGRLLIKIYNKNNQSISDIMIQQEYAKPYFGGTK